MTCGTAQIERLAPALLELRPGGPHYMAAAAISPVPVNEVSLALLTNPFGDSGFGFNIEVAHAFVGGGALSTMYYPVAFDDPRHVVTTVALEALAIIP